MLLLKSMATRTKRRIGGYFAKKIGEKAEQDILSHAHHQGILIIQIPSGCKWISANKVIPVPTPFDCVAVWGSKDIFFDIKTTDSDTFTYSMIHSKPHQLDWLVKIAHYKRNTGFLVHFRGPDLLIWYRSDVLRRTKPRESLSLKDGLNLGPLYTADLTRIFLME